MLLNYDPATGGVINRFVLRRAHALTELLHVPGGCPFSFVWYSSKPWTVQIRISESRRVEGHSTHGGAFRWLRERTRSP